MGNRKGHNEAQSFEEIVTDLKERKDKDIDHQHRGRPIYKAQSLDVQTEWLQDFVTQELSEVAQFATKDKVALEDTKEVQKRTLLYLRACAETGSFPSSLGLARALGYSDRALRYWRKNRPNTETALWLESFNETCANILSQASLKNNANPVIAMFLNKALYGFIDDVKLLVEINKEQPQMEERGYSVDDIRKRYVLDYPGDSVEEE